MPNIGEYYERYVIDGSFWRHEVREVLDVSCFGVLYRAIHEPTEGTIVETDEIPQLVTANVWKKWEELARLLGNQPRDP